jgi:iron complex outermembrane recepter protein
MIVARVGTRGNLRLRRVVPLRMVAVALCAALIAASAGAAEVGDTAAGADARLPTVIVTARLRPEDAESVPIALSVIDGQTLVRTATVNVAQLTQLVPSLNYSSPNPRNTSYTIRGLGSSVVAISQSNDGLEPGVGFYVDQVYHGRPATAAFDFADLERIEVLRGPQGTLFGKNTTAGAISITSRAPTFDAEGGAELSVGDYGYYQGKGFLSGPVAGDAVAGRLSFALTERGGVLRRTGDGQRVNDVNNLALRGQLLFAPKDGVRIRLSADYSSIDTVCCTQVYYGVGTTLKPASRQYPALAAGLGYRPPSLDPYSRLTDIDARLAVATNEGGIAAVADFALGGATLTSVSAWRYWNWDAANDRDYTRLSIQTVQHVPSRQDQYSQELRLASGTGGALEYVAGLYWFAQTITGEPISEYGPQATYWLLGGPAKYPGALLDGYGTDGHTRFHSDSYAGFGELTWRPLARLAVTGGLRYTAENKDGRFASTVYGGLATTSPALIKAKLSILRPQAYAASVSDGSPSGRVSVAFDWTPRLMSYLSWARGAKSGGINMSGLPLNAENLPALATAVVQPERSSTLEAGIKSRLWDERLEVHLDAYRTTVRDFQANVVDTAPGALRGYLANVDRVEVKGVELDSVLALSRGVSVYASAAWTDGRYASYANGPCPLESIAATTTVCDLSGRPLPGTPRFAASLGTELRRPIAVSGLSGDLFLRVDASEQGDIYGDPSDSRYTRIDGYTIVNASVGFRAAEHWEFLAFSRNALDRRYLQNLTVQAGNSGLVVGAPGDPRTVGLTLRGHF